MEERPILFSSEMVQAILDGRKTQTRRVANQDFRMKHAKRVITRANRDGWFDFIFEDETGMLRRCPYGMPGDLLWVRETWRIDAWSDDGMMAIDYEATPEITNTPWVDIPNDVDGELFNHYWEQASNELTSKGIKPDADGEYHWQPGRAPLKWRPSIHMPRWASRITLEIVSIRVERVQEINWFGVMEEGAPLSTYPHDRDCSDERLFSWWIDLWNSINTRRGYGWDVNPWVWVIEFKRLQP